MSTATIPAPQALAVQCVAFRITEASALDPITLFVRDTEPGVGQLVIECYGQTWATWWGRGRR